MKPRELTQDQIHGLQMLGNQTMKLLELHRANQELSHKTEYITREMGQQLRERIREVNRQNEILERMNRELQAITYISSHDLQEPLRKIQTFASWLLEKEGEKLSGKAKEYIMKINTSSNRLRVLISDLLSYSKTTDALKTFEMVRLSTIVAGIRDDFDEEFATPGPLWN